MTPWPLTKASRVMSALQRIGWSVGREVGPIRILVREGWAECAFPHADADELGPRLLARIGKRTGLNANDLTYDLTAALTPLLDRLQTAAQGDTALRNELRNLGRTLAALGGDLPAAEPPRPAKAPVPAVKPLPPVIRGPVPPPPPIPPSPHAEVRPLVRPAAVEPPVHAPQPTPRPVGPVGLSPNMQITDDDLPKLAEKFSLKAEGARWAAERLRMLADGADYAIEIEPRDRQLIDEANIVDCFLWMLNRAVPGTQDPVRYDNLAGCFEAAAAVVHLLIEAIHAANRNDLLERAFELAAEAQSALRSAVILIGAGPDNDQGKLYGWLRASGLERSIWVRRYMRQDDTADPAGSADLLKRIRQTSEAVQVGKDREKTRKKYIQKVKYHLKRIQTDPKTDVHTDWHTVISSVEALIADGMPPSNVELREIFQPVMDQIPDDIELPRSFSLMLREIDRYTALHRSANGQPAEPAEEAPTEEVRRVAELLRGRSLVLIGGDRRPAAAEALIRSFHLSNLDWIETREHATFTVFEPHVARPEVAAVLLAIRWSSHGYGDVKEYCAKYDKPLVRLPGGYNVNQVAYQLWHQIGAKLGVAKPAELNGDGAHHITALAVNGDGEG